MTSEPMTHVFLKPCGCLACAIINIPEMFGELSRAQRYAKKHDETYKLMETQAVREMEWKCPAHKEAGVIIETIMLHTSRERRQNDIMGRFEGSRTK